MFNDPSWFCLSAVFVVMLVGVLMQEVDWRGK